jgi:hypothetical protein
MRRSRLFALTALVTVLFCALLATDALPWLRGDVPWIPLLGRWRWPYGHPRWPWLIPAALGVTLYVAGAWHFLARERTARRSLLLWTFGGAAAPADA